MDTRTRLINELRWQRHDLWPDWEIPKRVLVRPTWQTKIAGIDRFTSEAQLAHLRMRPDPGLIRTHRPPPT